MILIAKGQEMEPASFVSQIFMLICNFYVHLCLQIVEQPPQMDIAQIVTLGLIKLMECARNQLKYPTV